MKKLQGNTGVVHISNHIPGGVDRVSSIEDSLPFSPFGKGARHFTRIEGDSKFRNPSRSIEPYFFRGTRGILLESKRIFFHNTKYLKKTIKPITLIFFAKP